MFRIFFLLLAFVSASALTADTVFIKTTKETLENVKTSPAAKKGETVVEEKNGATRVLKSNQITITPAPVVWEEAKKAEETESGKTGFLSRLFSKSQTETPTDESSTKKETSSESGEKTEPKTFFDRRFPEVAMGTMAFLWLIL